MFRGKRRSCIGVYGIGSVALFLTLGGGAYATTPVSVPLPTLKTMFSSTVTPRQLPARGRAPVSLKLAETIGTLDGSHPPALQEVDLGLDRHLGLSVDGLPVCRPPLQEHGPREGILPQCEDAKVGSGTIEVEVAFPEQQPVRINASVNVYNGGRVDGHTTFRLYTFFPAPVTGAIIASMEIHRRVEGIYGWKGTLSMPKIANGAGSVTYLGIRFRKGIFSAGCPTGKWQERAESHFADGTVTPAVFFERCGTTSG